MGGLERGVRQRQRKRKVLVLCGLVCLFVWFGERWKVDRARVHV